MRIGVVSDSHGRLDFLRDAVREMEDIDVLLHAGDYRKDAMMLSQELNIPVYAVVGNCDWFAPGPEEEIIEIEGRKILLTHGHQYGVKSGNEELIHKLKREGFDLVVYGHTHKAEVVPVGNAYLLNPGSIAKPRQGTARTYGIIEFRDRGLWVYIKEASR